jgi:hypothetical protein
LAKVPLLPPPARRPEDTPPKRQLQHEHVPRARGAQRDVSKGGQGAVEPPRHHNLGLPRVPRGDCDATTAPGNSPTKE